MRGPFVINGHAAGAVCNLSVGGKGARLSELVGAGQPVPLFFCVTTRAFREAVSSCQSEFDKLTAHLCGAESDLECTEVAAAIRDLVTDLAIPAEIEQAIHDMHRSLDTENLPWAVRSSIADEDGHCHSFAGMHDTFLDVRGSDAVIAAIRKVWISAWGDRAVLYRRQKNLSLAKIDPAVVVQRLVAATCSGVIFTCDPATGSTDRIVISAVAGRGESLVGGETSGQLYFIDKQTGVGRSLESQPELDLTDGQLRQLGAFATKIESYFGRPQDIEFCFDADGQLFILQSRDVVNPAEYGPAAGNHLVWDNSNIIESYSGVTTPMTFSFIRRAYSIVYYCFAEVMGIAPQKVRANRTAFENMLGFFRGRVYYNLKNWYRLVQLFPGYRYNSRFMESMMGLREPLSNGAMSEPPSRWRRWFIEFPALLRLLARSAWNFGRIEKIVDRFQEHFNRHYWEWSRIDFCRLKPHELHELYIRMEDTLLWNWKAPIINDFYVMVNYGILKKLCESWCGDDSGTLQNGLVCGEKEIESAEPAKLLLELVAKARRNPSLLDLILHAPEHDLPQLVAHDDRFSEFASAIARYLELYGLRSVHELKLEASTFRDQPHLLYRLIRNALTATEQTTVDMEARQEHIRTTTEKQAWDALNRSRSWLPRRFIFTRVLANARRGIRYRENMRLARTRIYGILRDMLRAMGEQFARDGILADAADIFYLTIDEMWDFVKGTAVSTDLRTLTMARKQEYERYRDEEVPAPDRRFDTFGLAYHRNAFRRSQPLKTGDALKHPEEQFILKGLGCCPGVVEGTVAVMNDPTMTNRPEGTILVAERTDPGWVPLFPTFSGILIERGSMLSHSAIVAREMGIPTIVGIAGITTVLHNGQRVRLDGRAGTVEILPEATVKLPATDEQSLSLLH